MNKLCSIFVYIPENVLESVKEAMFNAGAGQIGTYCRCCWQIQGIGQFFPLENSHPAVGSVGTLEKVVEYKVEFVCELSKVKGVIEAMKKAHPYEVPAYGVVELLDF
jgi:hypothetical protein